MNLTARPAAIVLALCACLVAAPPAMAGWGHDHHGGGPQHAPDFAYNILPAGQFGRLPLNANSTDQLPLYDALALRGNVTEADIQRLFKPENFEPTGTTTEVPTGRPGLKILRDKFGVPHIYGQTRADTWYGAGYVTGQDRSLLLPSGAARRVPPWPRCPASTPSRW